MPESVYLSRTTDVLFKRFLRFMRLVDSIIYMPSIVAAIRLPRHQ